jgi:Ala-tRNA(Pro) deacylase
MAGEAATDKSAAVAEMPTSPAQLLQRLDSLGISYRFYEHEAVFTVAQSQRVDRDIPGVHCRNLFLRDKKKAMFLVVAAHETAIDLKKLAPLIGGDRLSFGSPERLWEHLGVRPGSVCPYAIINDTAQAVTVILDAHMMAGEIVNYHPLINTMTIGVMPDDLIKFIRSCGHEPRIVDLTPAAPDSKE